MAGITGCELVLGLEEHTLGPITDGGTGGMNQAGTAGSDTSGTAGSAGTSGSSGSAGTPSTGGAPAAGAGGEAGAVAGAGGDAAGSGGVGGNPEPCLLCEAKTAMIHRYSFDGTGTAVADGIGTANGTVMGGPTLSGNGTLVLQGGAGTGDFVDLPDGLISDLTDATIEAWFIWSGANDWQRVFDFGSSTGTQSVTSLFFTPQSNVGGIQASFKITGGLAAEVNVASALTSGVQHQVVVVVEGDTMRLYVDGVARGLISPVGGLGNIDDTNVWLGRSQWSGDEYFGGTYDDFRIYDAALSPEIVTALHEAGADHQF